MNKIIFSLKLYILVLIVVLGLSSTAYAQANLIAEQGLQRYLAKGSSVPNRNVTEPDGINAEGEFSTPNDEDLFKQNRFFNIFGQTEIEVAVFIGNSGDQVAQNVSMVIDLPFSLKDPDYDTPNLTVENLDQCNTAGFNNTSIIIDNTIQEISFDGLSIAPGGICKITYQVRVHREVIVTSAFDYQATITADGLPNIQAVINNSNISNVSVNFSLEEEDSNNPHTRGNQFALGEVFNLEIGYGMKAGLATEFNYIIDEVDFNTVEIMEINPELAILEGEANCNFNVDIPFGHQGVFSLNGSSFICFTKDPEDQLNLTSEIVRGDTERNYLNWGELRFIHPVDSSERINTVFSEKIRTDLDSGNYLHTIRATATAGLAGRSRNFNFTVVKPDLDLLLEDLNQVEVLKPEDQVSYQITIDNLTQDAPDFGGPAYNINLKSNLSQSLINPRISRAEIFDFDGNLVRVLDVENDVSIIVNNQEMNLSWSIGDDDGDGINEPSLFAGESIELEIEFDVESPQNLILLGDDLIDEDSTLDFSIEIDRYQTMPNEADGLVINDDPETNSISIMLDSDGDGIWNIDELDQDENPIDTDRDGISNYLDLDSSNDGVLDEAEGIDENGNNRLEIDELENFDNDSDGIPNWIDTDSDGDGLESDIPDEEIDANTTDERTLNTDPNNPDTDADGFDDGQEFLNGDDPLDPNSPVEGGGADNDGDGLTNGEENEIYGTNPDLIDTDFDGINDGQEVLNNSNPLDPNDPNPGAGEDDDQDGLTNAQEIALNLDPNKPDTDGDGLNDGLEVANGLDADDANDPGNADSDGDGISDRDELLNGTDRFDENDPAPIDEDPDQDGLTNEEENNLGTDPNNPDSDNDGVNDGEEINLGLDPLDNDSDNDGVDDGNDAFPLDPDNGNPNPDQDSDQDGLTDAEEIALGSNPNNPDSDGDGLIDGEDPTPTDANGDFDGDGLSDLMEIGLGTNPKNADTDGDGLSDRIDPSPLDANGDKDGDGISDGEEILNGTNPNDADSDDDGINDLEDANPLVSDIQPGLDSDNDGLTDIQEGFIGTNPNNPDTDGDALSDGEDPSPNDAEGDADGDGVLDTREIELGLNPKSSDTDRDGISDGEEIDLGTDPLDVDSDNDGLADGRERGFGSNPLLADTDADGLNDAREIELGTGVNNPDTDNDGFTDGEEVDELNTDPLVANNLDPNIGEDPNETPSANVEGGGGCSLMPYQSPASLLIIFLFMGMIGGVGLIYRSRISRD
jgi:hypothetical protein